MAASAVIGAATLTMPAGGRAFAGEHANAKAEDHSAVPSRQIAIVIDDFGNSMKGTEQMLELPVHLTAAVMPFLPTTKQDAEAAHAKGHDVIVHLPMEPVRGNANWLGPNAILTSLPDDEIRRRVEAAIADVPYAIGMNNHMGSKATVDERVMRIVLQVCKEKGLFFLDSRTAWRSVVPKVAKELQVPLIRNDVFLDDVYTAHHVSHQLTVLKEHLAKQDSCVVIGHVGPPGLITYGALKSAIPQLRKDASFVGLTELLPLPSGVSVHYRQ
ncbi:divergent polysaccharide deacetylase family protein [Cohnella lubricantis]|uniref:Divergent polysaccharide deacetylase family protein n=2 Tax=Cohnella lubricantis TaxID=2163172 RepID=A0A841TCB6_9BACL|nr:divergent polysaccharide deacetylase family protein [Cohnella lubricantis]